MAHRGRPLARALVSPEDQQQAPTSNMPTIAHTTRLARGLSAGADLEYADDTTLAHALQGRSEITNGDPS